MDRNGNRSRSLLAVAAVAVTLAAAGCGMMERVTGGGGPTPMAQQGARITLSGAEEVPPAATRGTGAGTILVGEDRTVSGSVRTTGFNATMAHIHLAPRGANGPVIVPLTRSGEDTWTVPSGAKLTDAQYQAYKAGNLYVNVHSAQYPGGEVRGQIQP